jgi:hypothetical protein
VPSKNGINQGALQAAEKLFVLRCFERARLQPCRKWRKISSGFSRCGMVFFIFTIRSAFFRSPFSP